MKAMNRRARGASGERKAEQYLRSRGYAVLARNFRTRRAEIDLVARKGERIAFVEVKSWGAFAADSLEHAIGAAKRRRIVEAARCFLHDRPQLAGCGASFDVILVQGERITHLEDAFAEV